MPTIRHIGSARMLTLLLVLGVLLCALPMLAVLLALLRLDAQLVGFTRTDLAVLGAGVLVLVAWSLA